MKEFNRHKSAYPIGVVKSLTGLSKRQIRYYEETELVIPERTSGNQRMFSLVDVEKLLRIKKLLERGMTIEEVKSHFEKREDRDVDTNTLPHLDKLAENSDLKAKFRNEIQSLTDHKSAKRTRIREDHAPPSHRPPKHSTQQVKSLYPVKNRADLVENILNRRRNEERKNEPDEEQD